MGREWRTPASWFLGVAILVAVVWLMGGLDRKSIDDLLSVEVIFVWVTLTLLVRFLQVEILVRPVHALGGSISRWEAFWLGWARSFLNQIVPMSGVAYFAAVLRNRSGITWSQIASLTFPLFILGMLASALFGAMVTPFALDMDKTLDWVVLGLFIVALGATLVLVWGGGASMAILVSRFPRLQDAKEALFVLLERRRLFFLILALQFLTVVLRAARFHVLFVAVIEGGTIRTTAFLSALGELGFLMQVTPAGIGIREIAIVAGASLEGASVDLVLTIAVAERILIVLITAIAAMPAFWYLWRKQQCN